MIRVLLADDHAVVRRGIGRIIEDQDDMTVVGEVADGALVVEAVVQSGCDVLLLDLSLPNRSGLEALRELRSAAPKVRTVVLSMYPEDQLALHLVREGAAGYLNKERDPEEVLIAIRRAASGGRYLTDRLSLLAFSGDDAGDDLPHQRLTSREYQVFFLLIEGKTVSDVASELDLSASTVSNHVAAIRTKLGAASVGEIVRYASRVGLV